MKLQTIAIQYSCHISNRVLLNPHENCNCLEFQRIKGEKERSKAMIIENKENGELEIKTEGSIENAPPVLSGPNQSMTKDFYVMKFAEFINSENPRDLLSSLFCDIPDKLFLDLTAYEQLDFIHKLDTCVKIIKVYQQSAEFNHRNKVEALDLNDQVEIRKKDREYRVKPSDEDKSKRDKDTKLQKLVKTLRESGFSEEKILEMIHGKK